MHKYFLLQIIFLLCIFLFITAQDDIVVDPDDLGDRLKIGFVWNGNFSFNPLFINTDYEKELSELVFGNGLFSRADDGHIIHNLALKSEIQEGQVFRVQLKPDITFHDGKPITAEDVIFSYNLYKNFSLISSNYIGARLINSIETYGKDVIRFKMDPKYLEFFSSTLGLYPIIPKHYYQDADITTFNGVEISPVGNGPFAFSNYIPKKLLQINRNENYFFRIPNLSGIDFLFYDTYDQLLDAYLQEKVDLIKVHGKSTIQKVNQFAGNLIQTDVIKKKLYYINLNNRRKPFNEFAVRKALHYSINKEQIVNTLFNQNGEIATNSFPYLNNEIPPETEYFPLEGLQILLNKKYRKNVNEKLQRGNEELSFNLFFNKGSLFEESIARIISINLGEIGINVIPLGVKTNEMVQMLKTGEYQAAIQNFEFNPERIDETFYNFYTFEINKPGTFYNFKIAEIDDMLEKLLDISDSNEIRFTQSKIHNYLSKNIPAVYLFFSNYDYYALHPRFENFKSAYYQTTEKFLEKLKPKHEWFVKKDNQKY